MSENFASFYRKASSVRELVGKAPFPEKARFQITKVIELPKEQYRRYRNELWRDVSFINQGFFRGCQRQSDRFILCPLK